MTATAAHRSEGGAEPEARPSTRAELVGALVVAAVTIAITLPPVVSVGLRTDTGAHLRFAEATSLTGREWGPYSLFEQATIVLRALVPFGGLSKIWPVLGEQDVIWDVAGVTVLLAFAVFLSLVLYRRFLSDVRPLVGRATPAVAGVLSVVATFVAPITILTWARHQLHDGYIRLANYENPSVNVLKPLALVLFWVLLDRIAGRASGKVVAATAALSLLTLQAKPSYAVCLLPALVVMAVWRRIRGEQVDLRLWGLGFALPTALGLVYQAAVFRGEGSVGWAPFEIVRGILASRDMPLWQFAPLVVLSALFPVVVALVYRRDVWSSPYLVAAWLTFGSGLAVFCLFQVTERVDYGDLVWGAQVALFVLFVESLRLTAGKVLRPTADGGRRLGISTAVLGIVLALHLVSGGVLWYHEVFDPAQWW